MSNASSVDNQTADVGTQRLARVYATAFLNVSDKAGQTDELLAEIDALIDDVFQRQPDLETAFASPVVGRRARHAMIERAFGGRVSEMLLRILLVLNSHERLGLIRHIRSTLRTLNDERHRRIVVHVFSAIELDADQQQRIAETVRTRFDLEPILQIHIDPSLLGGLRLRIGDRQYDDTIRTRIDKIRNQIFARSSYEIQSRRDRFSNQ